MSTLYGNNISQTYQGLIKLADSTTGVTSTTQSFQDGLGNNLPIQVSTDTVNISGSFLVNGLPVTFTNTGSFATTGSNTFIGDQTITGSVNQTGTFYPDVIDWYSSSIVQSTGSYILTTDTNGVTQYDTYQNVASALQPYIETGSFNRDGLITTGSIEQTQSITGSLDVNGSGSFSNGLVRLGGEVIAPYIEMGDLSGSSQYPGMRFLIDTSKNSDIYSYFAIDNYGGDESGNSNFGFSSNTFTKVGPKLASTIYGPGLNNVGDASDTFLMYYSGSNSSVTGSGKLEILKDTTISGSLNVTGTITATSASITYLQTVYETASIIYSSGSNQLGDELTDTQTLSGSVKVQGTLTVNGVPVVTGSVNRDGLITTGSIGGSQSITGSVIVSGSLEVKGNTVITGSNTTVGDVIILNQQYQNSSAKFNITGSNSVSSSNIIFGAPLGVATLTGSVVITGSNNILLNGQRNDTLVTAGTYGHINGNFNIGNIIPTLNTGSLIKPTINSNTINSTVNLNFTTSSVLVIPSFANNIIQGGTNINHQSGSLGMSANIVMGNGFTSNANTTPLGLNTTVAQNLVAGFNSVVLNHNSSSITYNGNIGGGITVTNNYTSSVSTAVNNINVNTNIFNGSNNSIVVSGSNTSNRRTFQGNTVLGNSNIINSNHSGSTAGMLYNTAIMGDNLIVSASQTSGGNGGALFIGRYNATGSNQETSNDNIFVVGVGASAGARKNALRIDNNSNSTFTGSVQISGSLFLNGVAVNSDRNGLITTGSVGTTQYVTGGLNVNGNINVTGAFTAVNVVGTGISNFQDDVNITGQLNVKGKEITGYYITTGSYSMFNPQELSGSLRITSGSLKLDNGKNAAHLQDYYSRNVIYKDEDLAKILVGGNCNMDQIDTQFGVTSDSRNLTVLGGNTLAFRSGSYNTWIGSTGTFKSGSNNTYIGTNVPFTGGTGNFILGSFNSTLFSGTDYSNIFSIGTPSKQSLLYKNNNDPLTVANDFDVSGSVNITGQYLVNGVPFSGGTSGSSGTSGTSGVAGSSGTSGTSGISPDTTQFITTGSLSTTQSITGSLILSSSLGATTSSLFVKAPLSTISGSVNISGSLVMNPAGTGISSRGPVNDFYAGVGAGGLVTGHINSFGANQMRFTYGGALNFVAGQPSSRTAGILISSGSLTITGSLLQTNVSGATSATTSSLDVIRGNNWTVNLTSGSNTFVNVTGSFGGQSIDVLLNTTGSGTVSWSSNVKQPSGSIYTPSTGSTVDIVTLKYMNNTTSSFWYLTNVAKDINY